MITPRTFFGRREEQQKRTNNLLSIWQKAEDRMEKIRAKESEDIAEAERIYRQRIEDIREKTRKELDSPPDALTPAGRNETGKRTDVASEAAAFVTDLLQKYDVQEYIGTFNPIESSVCNETEIDIYDLISSESDV